VVLLLALLVVLVVLVASVLPATEGGAAQVDRREGVSLCEEHPRWSVCQPEPAAKRR
jgi:hypothetical protein